MELDVGWSMDALQPLRYKPTKSSSRLALVALPILHIILRT
jgi:hypothetical protein